MDTEYATFFASFLPRQAVGERLRRFETAAFIPAFEVGQRVRVNEGVDINGGLSGVVLYALTLDEYRVKFEDHRLIWTAVYERRELTAVTA